MLLFFLSLALPLQPMVVRAAPSSSSSSPRHDCPSKCGDVSIEYPFGIGPGCAMEKGFELHCNESQSQDGRRSSTAYFSDGDLPVLADILLLHGQVRVMSSVASMCPNNRSTTYLLNLSGTPFTLAEKENMFTVIGVDAIGLMAGSRQSAIYVIGCLTQSAAPETLTPAAQDGCTGVGCCQVALSSKLSYHDISVKEGDTSDDKNSTTSATIDDDDDTRQRCRYAMVVEAGRFKFHAAYLNSTTFWDERDGHVPTILNWAVGNTTCDVARQDAASYACRSSDSVCVGSATGLGYLCNCSQGYRGNPYLVDGCQDIDECGRTPSPCPAGPCINTRGGFYCRRRGLSQSATAMLSIGISVGVVIVAIAVTCSYLIRERKKLADIKQRYFRQHGGLLLLEQIGSSAGAGQAFTIFTEAELMEATGRFGDENVLGRGGHGTVYRGALKDGTVVAIKRC
ncbi:hypothetical protein ACJX0J_036482, partial [Zea mays]